ncbi:MAG: 1,2-diacylglycerol-3-alpha-glucose alpha,2-galactosyltransferase [Thermotogota bacterium]|nr:1,2-diacylglycerol-3-alpha-glucose alpha,2-galactosyltransferase [Thermotogota bacterium]MDK2865327.1 1,2-diacylglycerol-3-alpha-glucose alpha,2-galactosyltransferase [Thermotogota bacterium]HCZ07514.1 glycosyl transferase [Thermotogota bacterium]
MASVNVLSSSHKFKGQGVERAFYNHLKLLNILDFEIFVNRLRLTTDIVHVHTPDPQFFFKLLSSKKKALLVVSAHIVPASLVGSLKGTSLWLPIFSRYLRRFYNTCDVVLAVSDQVKDELLEFGVKEEKLKVFRNFVIRKEFEAFPSLEERTALRQRWNIPLNAFVVVGAGQVQPRKGVKDFIKVAEILGKDFCFVWAGGMPFKAFTAGYEEMKKLMESAPKNVKFLGTLDKDEMKNVYAMADAFFLPSHQETFGLVIPEAAGSGLPIVLRDLEVYVPIFGGRYLKGNSVEEFAEILEKLKEDSKFWEEWSRKARELFEEYTEDRAAVRLKNIYAEAYRKKFGRDLI